MMTLLITGAAGFVGLHAAEIALSRGHRVRLLDLRKPGADQAWMARRAVFQVGDILDADAVARAA